MKKEPEVLKWGTLLPKFSGETGFKPVCMAQGIYMHGRHYTKENFVRFSNMMPGDLRVSGEW